MKRSTSLCLAVFTLIALLSTTIPGVAVAAEGEPHATAVTLNDPSFEDNDGSWGGFANHVNLHYSTHDNSRWSSYGSYSAKLWADQVFWAPTAGQYTEVSQGNVDLTHASVIAFDSYMYTTNANGFFTAQVLVDNEVRWSQALPSTFTHFSDHIDVSDLTGMHTIRLRVRVNKWASGQRFEAYFDEIRSVPVAEDDVYIIDEDGELHIVAPGLLANDHDIDGGPLTVPQHDNPSHGTVELNGDGSLSYQPYLDFNGADSFTYQAYDGDYFSNTATVSIIVNSVNDSPTDISLSSSSVMENEPVGTLVGTFTTVDPEIEDTHSYVLVAGEGDSDNSDFTIVGDELITNSVFDYETKSIYNIRVQADDGNGGTCEEQFAITVTDANDTPTDIILDNSNVAENEPVGTLVGTFTTVDQDAGSSYTYDLVAGEGDIDNSVFTIVSDELTTNSVFDCETKSIYSIRVQADDGNSGIYEEQFTITVTDTNDAPSDITLDNSNVAENEPAGTLVGTFSATDQEIEDTHSYSLVPGEGDTDNSVFTIVEDELTTNSVFDCETKSTYSIRVQVDDGNGGIYEEQFIITITDVNEAPSDIALDNSAVAENEPVGTLVGAFTTIDQDAGSSYTYDLVAGEGDTDNSVFTIVSDELITNSMFDYETKSTYNIRVRSDDGNGEIYEEQFTITITNVNEVPTDIELDSSNVAENEPVGTVVGRLTTIDPDTGQNHFYYLVSGTGDTDNGAFIILANELRTSSDLDYETKDTYDIRVQSADSDNGIFEKQFTITITDVNDSPTSIGLSNDNVTENEPAGTAVGTFSTVDQDPGDSHTYHLVSGDGDTDNNAFTIVDGELRTESVLDREANWTCRIRVQVDDGNGGTLEKQFAITVTNVNEAPVAEDDTASTDEDTAVVINVLGNDADPERERLSIESVTQGEHGAVEIDGGKLTYTPVADFHGDDTFIYTTSDGKGGSDSATVTVTVNPVDETAAPDDKAETQGGDADAQDKQGESQDAEQDDDRMSEEAESTPSASGLIAWVWVAIGAGAILLGAAILLVMRRRRARA